jgi:hypothetical protein
MIFCTDCVGMPVLQEKVINPGIDYVSEYNEGREYYIRKYEIGMSTAIRDAGYTIAAHYVCDAKKIKTGDVWGGGRYYQGVVNPFETMFVKNNRYSAPLYDLYYDSMMPSSA